MIFFSCCCRNFLEIFFFHQYRWSETYSQIRSTHTNRIFQKNIFNEESKKKFEMNQWKPSFFMKEKRTSIQLTSRRSREKLIQKFNFQIKARCHHSLVLSPLFVCLCDHTYHYHANNTPPPLWDKIFVYHFLRGFFSFIQNAPNSITEFSLNCFAVLSMSSSSIAFYWIEFSKKKQEYSLRFCH